MITHRDASPLIDALRTADYGVTHIEAERRNGGASGLHRRQTQGAGACLNIVRCFHPNVFYSVDDLHSAAAGVAPLGRRRLSGLVPSLTKLQGRVNG